MASDEFLTRIDAHVARIDEHMARGNELMEQVRAEIELTRISYEHQLHVTREIVRQNRTAFQQVGDVLVEVRDDLRELKAETHAQTEAIFKMLDRFGNGGAEPASA